MPAILLVNDLKLEEIVAGRIRKLSHVIDRVAPSVLSFLKHRVTADISLDEKTCFGVNSTILNPHTVHVENVVVWNLIIMDIDAYISNWKCLDKIHLLVRLIILFFFSLEIAIIHQLIDLGHRLVKRLFCNRKHTVCHPFGDFIC